MNPALVWPHDPADHSGHRVRADEPDATGEGVAPPARTVTARICVDDPGAHEDLRAERRTIIVTQGDGASPVETSTASTKPRTRKGMTELRVIQGGPGDRAEVPVADRLEGIQVNER